ncbi:hypothetical protein BCR44DRAFT_1046739 [Catenaria anguillulae PL171]|uniref:Uncharacterized protein n=1 Tax=Catenaria anguillulae PL171 TaxID=765915 RepID=A0A1Y2H564_9FUNG|nr:hypothetical protein BCR44DRAFT_1046739 [Catenaria anguillulae PL171]
MTCECMCTNKERIMEGYVHGASGRTNRPIWTRIGEESHEYHVAKKTLHDDDCLYCGYRMTLSLKH